MGVARASRPRRQASAKSLWTSSAGRTAIFPHMMTFGVGVEISIVDGSEERAMGGFDDLQGFNMKSNELSCEILLDLTDG